MFDMTSAGDQLDQLLSSRDAADHQHEQQGNFGQPKRPYRNRLEILIGQIRGTIASAQSELEKVETIRSAISKAILADDFALVESLSRAAKTAKELGLERVYEAELLANQDLQPFRIMFEPEAAVEEFQNSMQTLQGDFANAIHKYCKVSTSSSTAQRNPVLSLGDQAKELVGEIRKASRILEEMQEFLGSEYERIQELVQMQDLLPDIEGCIQAVKGLGAMRSFKQESRREISSVRQEVSTLLESGEEFTSKSKRMRTPTNQERKKKRNNLLSGALLSDTPDESRHVSQRMSTQVRFLNESVLGTTASSVPKVLNPRRSSAHNLNNDDSTLVSALSLGSLSYLTTAKSSSVNDESATIKKSRQGKTGAFKRETPRNTQELRAILNKLPILRGATNLRKIATSLGLKVMKGHESRKALTSLILNSGKALPDEVHIFIAHKEAGPSEPEDDKLKVKELNEN